MPDPKDFKSKKDWMSACMHQNLKVEDKDQDQAVAICLNMWREKGKKKGRKKSAGGILRSLAAALVDDSAQGISNKPGKEGATHYYIVSKTYEFVTPESAEVGDFADHGYEYEDEKYDTLRELVNDYKNRENWVEWSSSHVRGEREWLISEGEPDYRKGGQTSYGLHIRRSDNKPLSKREVDAISKAFGVKHYTYVGTRME